MTVLHRSVRTRKLQAGTALSPKLLGYYRIPINGQIRIKGKQDIQTKVMGAFFALFADVECDMIPERTREGLAKAKAFGKKPGRSKGSLGVSRLDGKEDEIRHFLRLGAPKNATARITGVSRPTLYRFIDSRGLRPDS